eukprot:TRINITY_DN28917_c0_g1_i1.p1 TRINITY_DN28917_c0_g1~~TRINITY_DN28917_c0_g1_i1.p1  ORF type:complete len:381 (-),score=44.60 TRINITY_DN28917_c0_g1_i1:430-1572(-)
MARPGDFIFVRYDEPVGLHHERLVLALEPAAPGVYIIRTPDGDVYSEDYRLSSDDILEVRKLAQCHDVPNGVNPALIYRFEPIPTQVQIQQWTRGLAVRLNLGEPPLPPVAAPQDMLPRAGQAGRPADPSLVWIAVEDSGDIERGDVLSEPLPEGTIVQGTKALVPSAGDFLLAMRMPRKDVSVYIRDDLRMMPIVTDSSGRRVRPFAEAVLDLIGDEPEGGIGLTGPRTALWHAQSMRDAGGTYITRHETWVRSMNLPKHDRTAYEHEVLARALDAAVTVEQLNIPALKCCEILARRMQLLEEAFRLSPSSPDFSGSSHFMGWGSRADGCTVAPALTRHVADELRGEAAVAKESRKAREEIAAKKKLKGQKGKNGSEDV